MSPALLLMGRRPRKKLPTAKELLQPTAANHSEIKRRLDEAKLRQKHNYDKHAGADLPPLMEGDPVRMAPHPGATKWLPATVVDHHDSPGSCVVECHGCKYRRNRRHLRLSTFKVQAEDERENQPIFDRGITSHTTPPVPTSTFPPPSIPSAAPLEAARNPEAPSSPAKTQSPKPVKTRSGRISKAPQRLDL